MFSKFKVYGAILTVGLLLFGFQNCGDQVDFTTIGSDSYTKIDDVTELTETEAEDQIDEFLQQPPIIVPDTKTPTVENPPSLDEPQADDPNYYSHLCKVAQLLVQNRIIDDTEIVGLTGKWLVGARELDKVEDIKGNLILIGVGKDSSRHISHIKKITGNLLVCGMSIGSLQQIRGRTTIIKGEVGDIDDVTGQLILLRSPHTGKATNISGRFLKF